MIKLSGNLQVKKINGAKGAFSVGELVTEIGAFKVKDALLDQFEEGIYQGEFTISGIYLSSYIWRGKAMTDIRANLAEVNLEPLATSFGRPRQDDQPEEPDPIDEHLPVTLRADKEEPAVETAVVVVTPSGQIDADPRLEALVKLFGAELGARIWREESGIKLDPTVDRGVFRQQRDHLKELGYRFEPKSQSWLKD